jgi:CHAP domain-containing protein
MIRIKLDPAGMRASGLQFVAASDAMNTMAAQLAATALPAMPPEMAARHRLNLAAVAQRLRICAAQALTLSEELQLRAAAAQAADAPSMHDQVLAAAQVHRAVTLDVAIVGAGGAVQSARLRVGRSGVSVTAQSGLRLTMPELALDHGSERVDQPAHEPAQRPGDDPQPVPEPARPVEQGSPIGGPVAAGVHEAAALPAPSHPAGPHYLFGDPLDPSGDGGPQLRADHHDGHGAPPHKEMPHATDTDRQDWACWMAGTAAHAGLPPALPLMIGLAAGGMRNMPEYDGTVGFFGTHAGQTYAPAGHGLPRGEQPDAEWWLDHPAAQLDHLVRQLQDSSGGLRTGDLSDPEALSRWAHEVQPDIDPQELVSIHDAAADLVARCRGGEGMAASSVVKIAASQLGVHERAPNAGPEVDQYLAAAGAPSGSPWCASFVTWSMQQAGHEMPGTGWAAVSNWVHAAQSGQHGLHIVSAADARPGDIVAYDWGHGTDFAADGHIGLLESGVKDGHFIALEGNSGDAVARMGRSMSEANIVFIRAGG